MKNLTEEELININGGHDGAAYEAGKAVGTVLNVLLLFSGVGALTRGWRILKLL